MKTERDMTEDVLNAIRAYLAADSTPYAIAISGEWGVGKTHLVQSAVGNVFDASSFLYVSLYGLSTVAEIEAAVLSAASKFGEDDAGVLSSFLNANSELVEGVRIGGLGYAVQFGLRKWRKRELDRAKRLTLCFDDIERWHGDIGICLGYINGLAEHEGAKCIIIGDLSKVPEDQITELRRARTKIIRYVYTLSHSPTKLLEISLSLASIKDDRARSVIDSLVRQNTPRLVQFLEQIDCQNIRLLADAFHLCGEVASHHIDAFEVAPTQAVTFLEVTLAAVKLIQMKASDESYLTNLKQYDDQSSYSIMKRLGYYQGEEAESQLPFIEKELLEAVFHSSDDIHVSSILRLASHGFYRSADFVDFSSRWKHPEPYEYYLDTFQFWYLCDSKSGELFTKVMSDVFEKRAITHPGVLLRFADRLTSDIKRGVVNLDFEGTKERLTKLIDELYEKDEMECVKAVGERFFSDKYIYCLDLLEYVKERNSQYLAEKNRSATESVWSRITATPDQYLEIMDSEENKPIFAMYSETTDVLQALESLTNSQLFELTRWMGSHVASTTQKPAVQEERERELKVAELLNKEYGTKFSVRAGHMKQISRVLRNQKTDYDPDYVAKMPNK
jgi:hypothetical protein